MPKHHARYREGGGLMTAVTLDATDAAGGVQGG